MIKFACADNCTVTGRPLKRLHFSCLRCADRRGRRKGRIRGCFFNSLMGVWLPVQRREVSAIWWEYEPDLLPKVYILYIDEQRRFRAIKDVLLNKLWELALKNNRKERALLLKKLVSLCEFLAS